MPANDAGSAYIKSRQYTIRNVSPQLDQALRRKAKQKGTSLNAILIESLSASVGEEGSRYHDLDSLAGTWIEDESCEAALDSFNKIDPSDWQ